MPTSSTPSSAAGTSPLVEQMHPDLAKVEITSAFGNRLSVVLHSYNGMPETLAEPLSAITVYGDGRIEYHPASTTGGLS
ncbi:hypothetical protein [Streptomyces sp. NPDC051994]|uniref:hypothetical protein n=1 Tax=unclassified Streptomyces TaxID=2593676 RepID=UPI00343A6A49